MPTTNPAAGEAMPNYTLDDVQSDIWDLFQLLDANFDLLQEMPFERDGKRDDLLDKISALARISRDYAQRISLSVDDNFQRIARGGRS